jgi:hypothetical protein
MKRFLAMSSLMLSLSAYSQSYLIMGNGVVLTTDNAGFAYDLGNFILPYKITLNGGQYFAEEGRLVTVDERGFLYRKEEKAPNKIKGKGSNYFLTENGKLTTIDSAGFFYEYDKESAFKKAVGFGGNFFTVKPEEKKLTVDLFTINRKGNYFKMNVPNLDAGTIVVMGGNYFQTSSGTIFTVTKEGLVFPKPEVKVGAVKKKGGNFFVDSNNSIFTISEDGFLLMPTVPASLQVASITKLGQNYFLDQEGRLFVIDSMGGINEREMKSHDLKDVKILSL